MPCRTPARTILRPRATTHRLRHPGKPPSIAQDSLHFLRPLGQGVHNVPSPSRPDAWVSMSQWPTQHLLSGPPSPIRSLNRFGSPTMEGRLEGSLEGVGRIPEYFKAAATRPLLSCAALAPRLPDSWAHCFSVVSSHSPARPHGAVFFSLV